MSEMMKTRDLDSYSLRQLKDEFKRRGMDWNCYGKAAVAKRLAREAIMNDLDEHVEDECVGARVARGLEEGRVWASKRARAPSSRPLARRTNSGCTGSHVTIGLRASHLAAAREERVPHSSTASHVSTTGHLSSTTTAPPPRHHHHRHGRFPLSRAR